MESMRETWTDARLDDLNERVADLGRRMDEGFQGVDRKIDTLRAETKAETRELRAEIGALHRLVLQAGGGIVVTMVIGFLGIVASGH